MKDSNKVIEKDSGGSDAAAPEILFTYTKEQTEDLEDLGITIEPNGILVFTLETPVHDGFSKKHDTIRFLPELYAKDFPEIDRNYEGITGMSLSNDKGSADTSFVVAVLMAMAKRAGKPVDSSVFLDMDDFDDFQRLIPVIQIFYAVISSDLMDDAKKVFEEHFHTVPTDEDEQILGIGAIPDFSKKTVAFPLTTPVETAAGTVEELEMNFRLKAKARTQVQNVCDEKWGNVGGTEMFQPLHNFVYAWKAMHKAGSKITLEELLGMSYRDFRRLERVASNFLLYARLSSFKARKAKKR